MENSYFVFTEKGESIEIEKFHICTWEFGNNSSLIEFGCEIIAASLFGKQSVKFELFVPWLQSKYKLDDYYNKLKDPSNSRFIFNDSISNTNYLDDSSNENGVIHTFTEKNRLAMLPAIVISDTIGHRVRIEVDLSLYGRLQNEDRPNVYIRFCITPTGELLSTRKKGIAKSTIIYDVKVNQRRNIPEQVNKEIIQKKELCNIKCCFCLHIIPNSYDLVFFDSGSLKNVRNLEFEPFKQYLKDQRIQKDDLIVVFNKKDKSESYSFFSIYTKEHIGADQFALALLVNLVSGILLFIPAYKTGLTDIEKSKPLVSQLPFLFWLAVFLILIMFLYFLRPTWFKKTKQN